MPDKDDKCPDRFIAISDGLESTVHDTCRERDLFPTTTGNRYYSCRMCSDLTANLIATALNYMMEHHPEELAKCVTM